MSRLSSAGHSTPSVSSSSSSSSTRWRHHFRVPERDVVLTITATLAMRPVGSPAHRHDGRPRPGAARLMANVIFSRPSSQLMRLRAQATRCSSYCGTPYGIGMGGECGVRRVISPWSMLQDAGAACSRGSCRVGCLQPAASPADLVRRAAGVAQLGMACHVLGVRTSGAAGSLHSDEGPGVGGMEAAPRCTHD